MKLILISGKAQHGKDTTASIIKGILNSKRPDIRVKIAHLGDLLKYMCREYAGWDGNKDKTGRTLLQRYGTDVIRNDNPTYWVDFMADVIKWFSDCWDFFIIPDIRFKNEVNKLDGDDTIKIRVVRPGFDNGLSEEQRNHISETDLDDYTDWSYVISNDSTLLDLHNTVEKMLITLEGNCI